MRADIVAPTCADVACNPLKSLRRARAPTCADVTAKSLKSLRRRCVVHVPIILRIINGRRLLAAGGPIQVRTVSANAAVAELTRQTGMKAAVVEL